MFSKENLLRLFSFPLPGEEAQWKLAPVGRRSALGAVEEFRRAAVLVPLVKKTSEMFVVLTLRAQYDGIHSAQVSFPGGKFEPHESNPVDVALREANEETGIPVNLVSIIGRLSPLHIPVSKMQVFPVVGWIEDEFDFKPDPREVQRIIEYPVKHLLNLEISFSENIYPRAGVEIPYFEIDGEKVWGATAMMLSELIEVLKES
ncbi:MAG: CoA pyrophosphatase [Bacteroidetes bacterium]|nr:CoA pyrophosphatase [Bacteroidota bacterium]